GEALVGVPRPHGRKTLRDDPYVRYHVAAQAHSYDAELRSPAGKVTGVQLTAHAESVLTMIRELAKGEEDENTRYWRIDPSKPSRALRAGSRSRTATRPIHPTA